MYKYDSDDGAATKDTKPTEGSGTWPTNGSPGVTAPSVFQAWHYAMVIDELLYIVTTLGGTPQRANDNQIGDLLALRVLASLCAASDTGSTTTERLRLVLASTTSRASGAGSLAGACENMHASGDLAAVLASTGGAGVVENAADKSLIAACSGVEALSGGAHVAGLASTLSQFGASAAAVAVVASSTVVGGGTNAMIAASSGACETMGSRVAIIASRVAAGGTDANGSQCLIGAVSDCTTDANASQAAALASTNSDILGETGTVTNGAVIASSGSSIKGDAAAVTNGAVIASVDCIVTAEDGSPSNVAIIGSDGCIINSTGQGVVLGSLNTELAAGGPNVVAGGYSATPITPSGANQSVTWMIESQPGDLELAGMANNGSLDYAEWFELHPDCPAPMPGRLLSQEIHDDSLRVTLASEGADVIGIVSAFPGVLGGSDNLGWAHRYLRDEWGRRLRDKDGGLTQNPEFDPSRKHVPRRDRPDEWVMVGLVGQLRLWVEDGVRVGDYIEPGAEPGQGRAAKGRTRIRVMRKHADHIAEVVIR